MAIAVHLRAVLPVFPRDTDHHPGQETILPLQHQGFPRGEEAVARVAGTPCVQEVGAEQRAVAQERDQPAVRHHGHIRHRETREVPVDHTLHHLRLHRRKAHRPVVVAADPLQGPAVGQEGEEGREQGSQ